MPLYSIIEGAGDGSTTENGIPNVSQYGWSSYEVSEYKQLIEYVDDARKYAESIKGVAEFALSVQQAIIQLKAEVDAMAEDLRLDYAEAQALYAEIKVFYNQIIEIDSRVKILAQQVTVDAADVRGILAQVTSLRNEVRALKASVDTSEQNAASSATAAQVAETGAEDYFNKTYDLYIDLKKGQVYRGPWNPNSGAYPTNKTTNAVWDVVLNEGQQEAVFDEKRWFWGDRLSYVKDEDKFYQIEAGTSVKSVNGKAGAVVLTAADVGAVSKAGDTITGTLYADSSTGQFRGPSTGNIDVNTLITQNSGEWSYVCTVRNGSTNIFPFSNNANGILTFNTHQGDYSHQIGMSSNGKLYHRHGKNAWGQVYTSTQKPTANGIGAVSQSGDTMSGSLKTTVSDYAAFIAERNGTQASFGCSQIKGEFVFGGRQTTSGDLTQFIKMGVNRLKWSDRGSEYDIYHGGNKPTALDLNVFNAHVATVNTQDWNTLTQAGSYLISLAVGANFPSVPGLPPVYNYGNLLVQNSNGVICQMYVADRSASVLIRTKFSNNPWGSWRTTGSSVSAVVNGSVDLNDFSNGGTYNMYRRPSSVFTNAPADFNYGTLQVIGQGIENASFVTQILTWKDDSARQMIRTRDDGSFAWGPWRKIYSSGQKPTATDVGADPAGTAESAVANHATKVDAHPMTGVAGLEDALSGKADVSSLFEASPLPDVWIPFNDSLRMITGFGDYDKVYIGDQYLELNSRSANFERATTATYVDKSGVLRTADINEPRFEKQGLLIEGQSTNLFLNSEIGVTQSITTQADKYTISFYGTGSVSLSGAATGSLQGSGEKSRVSKTIDCSAGSASIAVTGQVLKVQFEKLPLASSYIPTADSATTRAADRCWITGACNRPGSLMHSSIGVQFNVQSLPLSSRVRRIIWSETIGGNGPFFGMRIRDKEFLAISSPDASHEVKCTIGEGASTGSFTSLGHLYINGVKYSGAATTRTADISDKLWVGCSSGSNNELFGHVRNLRIWHSALSDCQIRDLG